VLLERIGIQTVLVPGHIPDRCLTLVAVLVTGAGLERPGIAVLELSLTRRIARSPLLYLQAGACLVASAWSLPLLHGCHNSCRCKEKDQHCTECYLLEHCFPSWRVEDYSSRFTRSHQTIDRDNQTFSRTESYTSVPVGYGNERDHQERPATPQEPCLLHTGVCQNYLLRILPERKTGRKIKKMKAIHPADTAIGRDSCSLGIT
jgi:hypothetical protein